MQLKQNVIEQNENLYYVASCQMWNMLAYNADNMSLSNEKMVSWILSTEVSSPKHLFIFIITGEVIHVNTDQNLWANQLIFRVVNY